MVNINKNSEDAFTASVLGTDRAGHGVLIQNDGLVVTIGYLIAEAKGLDFSRERPNGFGTCSGA